MPETRSTQAAAAALPHLTCRLTPSDQAIIAARTPLRFHTYTPTLTDSSAAAPAAAHPILEPFLPLSSPTPSTLPLILTPPRPSDAAALVQTLNDPLVALQLQGPPYPYSDALAGEYVALKISETERLLERLGERARRALRPSAEADIAGEGSVRGGKDRDTDEDGEPWLDELPLCAVRRADTGEYVGDFGVHRWRFEDVPEGQERERAIKENEAKVAGDSSVLWSFGCASLLPALCLLKRALTCSRTRWLPRTPCRLPPPRVPRPRPHDSRPAHRPRHIPLRVPRRRRGARLGVRRQSCEHPDAGEVRPEEVRQGRVRGVRVEGRGREGDDDAQGAEGGLCSSVRTRQCTLPSLCGDTETQREVESETNTRVSHVLGAERVRSRVPHGARVLLVHEALLEPVAAVDAVPPVPRADPVAVGGRRGARVRGVLGLGRLLVLLLLRGLRSWVSESRQKEADGKRG